MGRPAQISNDALIGAATMVAAKLGPARTSIAAVSREAGVPTGSIYHRLPSRDARARHAEAVVLNSHRREEFLRSGAPAEYRARAVKLAADMRDGIADAA